VRRVELGGLAMLRTRTLVNSDLWDGDSLKWFVYWMQSIPGANHRLTYNGTRLTNWRVFIGDFDQMIQRALKLDGQ
jgi:hypothetical protein